MITQAPRGVQDWFGEAMHKRRIVEETARSLANAYHMQEIITPMFEHTVLFQRGVGETTDVVQKEMYTFTDKGNRSITLKPEGTAGTIRAYLEHNMYAEPAPKKLFYVTQAFRYEKPQSGRLRQHHQFGVEIVGSESPLVEAELMSFITELLKRLGLKGAKLHINSIGCAACRKQYNEALLAFLNDKKDSLCPLCRERMMKNPLRVLDCKNPECREIVKASPRTVDYLDEACRNHFESLQKILTSLGIAYEVDTDIVRGLDYYTRTVFEFVNQDGFALCGGGRYDNLVKEIDEKQDIPAAGFGMGIERILSFMEAEQIAFPPEDPVALYVGVLGEDAIATAYGIVRRLRARGIVCETDYMGRSVKAQMKYANKIGAKKAVIIGSEELEQNEADLKDMESGESIRVRLDEIENAIGGAGNV